MKVLNSTIIHSAYGQVFGLIMQFLSYINILTVPNTTTKNYIYYFILSFSLLFERKQLYEGYF